MLKIEILAENNFKGFELETKALVQIENCPICGSRENQDELCKLKDSVEFSWCRSCSHMYLSRRPSQQWYSDFYYTEWDKGPRPPSSRALRSAAIKSVRRKVVGAIDLLTNRKETILNEITNSVPNFCSPVMARGQKVLDIGCGYGWSLAKFRDLGYKAYGIENSTHRAEFVRNNGIECQNIPVESLTPASFGTRFDLVTSNHVLEHVYEPSNFMKAVEKVVEPGKYICISVPNFYKDFFFNGFVSILHIHCFTPKSLSRLLSKHGFKVRKIALDYQIRVLAQKTEDGLQDPYPFEDEGISSDVLSKYMIANTLPGLTIDNLKAKSNYYLISWGVLNSSNFDYSRILDNVFDITVEPIAETQLAATEKRIASAENTRMSLCRISLDGDGAMPVHFFKKNGTFSRFWSGDW